LAERIRQLRGEKAVKIEHGSHLDQLKTTSREARQSQPRRESGDFADRLARQSESASAQASAKAAKTAQASAAKTSPETQPENPQDSYTSRLLAAKRKVWEDQDQK
jgi:hypothetical protein